MFSLSFVSRNLFISLFISSVMSWLFCVILFSLLLFGGFFVFVVVVVVFYIFSPLLLTSGLIMLWSEKIHDTISVFFNLLRLDLQTKM